MKVLSSKPVSISEVKEILKKRGKEGELGYEQQTALEYSENFSKHSKSEAEKLIKQLMKNEKISEETAIKIADLCPKSADLLKAVLIKDKIDLSDDEINELVKLFTK